MATVAPNNLWVMYALLDPYLGSLRKGGIVGDTAHVAGGGYHISRDDLKFHGQGGDYSIQAPADKRGPGNAAAAIDLTLSTTEMKTVSKRLKAAMEGTDYDPRIEPLREFIGTVNGTQVCGFNRYKTGRATGWYPSGYSESSHLWHVHLSFFRAYCNDKNSILGVAEVVAGLKPGTLGWKGAAAPKPKPAEPAAPADPKPPVVEEVPKLVVELDAPGAGNWQGAVQNIATGEWFIGHARARTDGGEDAVFYRFDKDGVYQDKVELLGGDHPTAFGVSESNIIWTSHNGPRAPGGEPVNDIVTFRWQPNAQLLKQNCQVMHAFTDLPAHISFSPTRGWAVIRERTKTTDYFRRYSKQNILDGIDKQVGKTVELPRVAPATQGFTCIEDRLYVFRGAANEKTWIEVWSFTTGQKLREYDVTHVGLYEGEVETLKPAAQVDGTPFLPTDQAKLMREAEGMDGRYFCVKVAQKAMRKQRIYEMPAKWRTA